MASACPRSATSPRLNVSRPVLHEALVDLAAKGGVTAIIQVGGSIRDEQSIEAANKYNMAMVFTGVRHFKH